MVQIGAAAQRAFSPLDVSEAFKEYYKKQRDPCSALLNTPLHVATLNGDIERVKRLLSTQKDDVSAKDINGYTALHHAALRGCHGIAKVLMDSGANVNAVARDGNTPLHKAAQGGHVEIAKLLIDVGSDPSALNQMGERPIDVCAKRKHTELTVFLRHHVGAGDQ